jgi:hypothetical protein
VKQDITQNYNVRLQENTNNTKMWINRIKIRELKCETRHHTKLQYKTTGEYKQY